MKLVTLVVLVCAYSLDAQAQATDPCRARIPVSVAQLIMEHFPEHRLPLVSDGDPDSVEFDKEKGGSGCIVVAEGDFNGDKRKDFAVGLTPTTAATPIVAVALSNGRSWNISKVDSRVETAASLYVDRAKPGVFKRFEGFDSDVKLETDERDSLRCRNDALIVGATESTGIANCYINNRWLYVWISD